ncbi:MAG: 50S ribosomal protein L10 [Candidatus Aminicenantales bacterium]
MKPDKKVKTIQEVAEIFQAHQTLYLCDYTHMTVAQAVDLRKTLRRNSSAFKVVKNRLALRALREDFPADLRPHFQGATAIAYTSEDPLALARVLKDFSTQNKVLTVKGGLIEGQLFPAERFEEITRMRSRSELLGKIGYLMTFPLTRWLRNMQAPLGHLGSLLSQFKNKK